MGTGDSQKSHPKATSESESQVLFESRVPLIDKESNLALFPIRSGGRTSEVFNCYFISTLSVVCCLLIGKNSEVASYHAELSADNSELEKHCKSTFKHKR